MLTLRDYQQQVFEGATESFKKGNRRVLLVAPCGFGKTILLAKMAAAARDNGKVVWFILPRQEILEQTYDTFRMCNIDLSNIYIGMIITMANHITEYPKPDLIIYDECHISVSNTYYKISNSFPNAFIIGATASPVRTDNRPLGDLYQDLVEGVNVKWLIAHNYLAPYKYYSVTVADLTEADNGEKFDELKSSDILMKPKIYGNVIKNWNDLGEEKQTVVYCCSVKHSKAVAKAFNDVGITAEHIDGTTPPNTRAEIVKRFKSGETKVLCNVDIVSMGFDMPDIGCVILLRPTHSCSLYIQQTGRALRYKPNKVAIIIDMVANYMRFQMPDEPYEWSLTQSPKNRKQHNDDGTLAIRQCVNCYRTFKTAPKCPYCGYEYTVTAKELKTMETAKLKLIEAEKLAEERKNKKYRRMEVGQARTIADLQKIAHERGYNQGWVWQMARVKKIYK